MKTQGLALGSNLDLFSGRVETKQGTKGSKMSIRGNVFKQLFIRTFVVQ